MAFLGVLVGTALLLLAIVMLMLFIFLFSKPSHTPSPQKVREDMRKIKKQINAADE